MNPGHTSRLTCLSYVVMLVFLQYLPLVIGFSSRCLRLYLYLPTLSFMLYVQLIFIDLCPIHTNVR